MAVLILTATQSKAIARAVELARDQCLPWEIGKHIAIDDRAKPVATLTLDQRPTENLLPRAQHLMLGDYRCAISFEEQPAGIMRHLSVSSSANPSKVPGLVAMRMIAKAFGFSDIPPTRVGRMWLEEFEPGRHAVNVIEVEP